MIKRRVKHYKETEFERILKLTWKEVKFDVKKMINFLLFYRPDSKGDKILHICEVVFIWLALTKLILSF